MLTTTSAGKLKATINRFKHEVPAPESDNWMAKSPGQLWTSVLVQIAVIGNANRGDALKDLVARKANWYESLLAMDSKPRSKEIHRQLLEARVRYTSSLIGKCRKTAAAAYNFEVLEAYGGPKSYFEKIAEVPDENWRVAIVGDDLSYVKNKGARDLLIGLGLLRDAVALDSRLVKVLRYVGVDLPKDITTNKPKYKALEREIIEKVCVPCGITGGHLDRILFGKYKEIVV